MGCCASKEDPGEEWARPVKVKSEEIKLPEVTWETNAAWGESIEALWKEAVEAGKQDAFRAEFQATINKRARDWIDAEHPACARAGTIEDMGESVYPTTTGPSRFPGKTILTLDDDFTGVLYSASLVVAPPFEGDGADRNWAVPGTARKTPEFDGGQHYMLMMLANIRNIDVNVNHAVIHIFMGADMVTCKFDVTNTQPSIRMLSKEQSDAFKEANASLYAQGRATPDKMRQELPFVSHMFRTMVASAASLHPGSTIWDGGELPFSVNGTPYPHPTRLLISRDFDKMAEGIDTADFRVVAPSTSSTDKPVVLLRNLTTDKDPGGVIAVLLTAAIDSNIVWPKYGAHIKTPAFKAAEEAALRYVKKMNKEGRIQTCTVRIAMGADQKVYKFVGEKFPGSPTAAADPGAGKEDWAQGGGLERFGVKLERQEEHRLFDSESHFQAIKQQMRERAQQNPELYQNIVPQIAFMSAKHVLEINFPGCEISDEGEFPATTPEGEVMHLCDTRLVVARDPKQAPKSVVAAMHVVPRPNAAAAAAIPFASDTNWLDTPELKVAEDLLLTLLKKWHQEGKVSEVDCMAQVMIGMDASTYQFVDGEKFVDYSDERMAQFKWN